MSSQTETFSISYGRKREILESFYQVSLNSMSIFYVILAFIGSVFCTSVTFPVLESAKLSALWGNFHIIVSFFPSQW